MQPSFRSIVNSNFRNISGPLHEGGCKKKDWNRDRNGCESSTGNAMLCAARSIQGCVPFGSWETIPCSPRHGQDVTLLHIVTWPSLDTLKIINWLGQNTVSSCTFWLVVSTPLKNEFVSWDYYSTYMESHKKCLKHLETTNQDWSTKVERNMANPRDIRSYPVHGLHGRHEDLVFIQNGRGGAGCQSGTNIPNL